MSEEYRPLADLDDSALVNLARSDQDAFGELYARYVKRIYNYVYYRTGNHHDAEDLTARVFHRALQHIGKYEDRGLPFSAWLYRIAHNLVVNWHRDRKRRKVVPLDDLIVFAVRGDAPEKSAERREEEEHLLLAIHNLPEDRQQLLLLKFVERLSNAEIGQIMGRTEGAIKSLYHRTLIALRSEITQIQQSPGSAKLPSRRRSRRRKQ
ncbi:MAG: sigma-70 family RNA polymerase sigma factor [Anaerolineae bacterium]|nr:sigma-70 family RNA polymerase sigma factor [Anaerolineae bacterium]